MQTKLRGALSDVWTGAYLGLLLGLALGLGHVLVRFVLPGMVEETRYEVAALLLVVEAGGLALIGVGLGAILAAARVALALTAPRPAVAAAGLVLAAAAVRVALGLVARATTRPNREPVLPDEPLVVVLAVLAALAVAALARAGLQRGRRRLVFGALAALLAVSASPTALGAAAFAKTVRAQEQNVGPQALEEIAARWGFRPGFAADGSHPNVVVVTIDSLRPDYLASYGHPRVKTPNLDQLAREGARFTAATTVQPTTLPAHLSLFSGVYPATHGARSHAADPLSDRFDTLAMILKAGGYRTGGFYTYVGLRPEHSNLQRGFDTYQDVIIGLPANMRNPVLGQGTRVVRRVLNHAPVGKLAEDLFSPSRDLEERISERADVTTDEALTWLDSVRGQPFFLWVHYFDPHYPYTPPPPFDTMYDPDYQGSASGDWPTIRFLQGGGRLSPRDADHLRAQYAGEVSFNDQELGRLFQRLRESNVWDQTVVVVLADHGQSLGANDFWFHGSSVTEPVAAIPLLLRYPPLVPPTVVRAAVQTIDVMPTILDLVGVPPGDRVEGESLLPLVQGETSGAERATIVERFDRYLAAVRRGEWKLVLDFGDNARALYNLARDPQESTNLIEREPQIAGSLQQAYDTWLDAHP